MFNNLCVFESLFDIFNTIRMLLPWAFPGLRGWGGQVKNLNFYLSQLSLSIFAILLFHGRLKFAKLQFLNLEFFQSA